MSQTAVNDKERQQRFILQDSLWKVMVQLSWPAIMAMVLYGLNAVIAAVFVARYIGETALAGVSVAYPLTMFGMGFGSLIGVGAGAVLSIAIGRQDKAVQQRLLGHVNSLSLIVTIVYMTVALPLSSEFVKVMGGQGEALVLGERYFTITVLGSFFWIYGLAANMIVRAEGKMRTAALVMGIGLAADVAFNYLLVAALDLGVAGAAWATNAGMIVYTLLGFVYFSKGWSSFQTKASAFYWDWATVKSIVSLGMASLIMNVMNLVQGIVVFNALSRYGTMQDIAFYGVVYRVFTFLLTPIFGLMRALQPVVGINYGAGQYERVIRAYQIFTAASVLLTLPFWLISMLAPGSVLGLMLPGSAMTAEQSQFFRIYMAILPLLSIVFMAMTFFPAIDKGRPAAVIGLVRQLVFYIPVMLIAPAITGVAGVYWGALAIDTLMVVWTVLLIQKECRALRKKTWPQAGLTVPL
ncbi:MATE family efflux transporter [Paenibacillus arenilitoris]|uniref:Multidrug export protein MepA n=1 Tax=Paenibacillus arenilitoris TaxID=2772299 RepID=A0A927H404_9BACL|nr:MATE family efflux transporter [Paenibacillus arenilitoris]MBD2866958.1 MATE family efflux transporter [Paenibacillus arenilitoris]